MKYLSPVKIKSSVYIPEMNHQSTTFQRFSVMTFLYSMEKARILNFYCNHCIPQTLPSETKRGRPESQ
jgi:hypothetical protein